VFCQFCGGQTEIQLVDDRERPVCTACGRVTFLDPKLAVAVLIERDGKILLGRRAHNTRSPGKWSFPAGFVERGEQVELAAIREVREETGLEIALDNLIGLFSQNGEIVVLAVYAARTEDEPVAGDDLTDVGWFSLDDLPELAFDHDWRIIDRWQAVAAG
jgi:mutator protein MutT